MGDVLRNSKKSFLYYMYEKGNIMKEQKIFTGAAQTKNGNIFYIYFIYFFSLHFKFVIIIYFLKLFMSFIEILE